MHEVLTVSQDHQVVMGIKDSGAQMVHLGHQDPLVTVVDLVQRVIKVHRVPLEPRV